MTYPYRILAGACLGLLLQGPLVAQDVELWGRIHDTEPPPAYYEILKEDPGAFQFRRALFRRGLGIDVLPEVRSDGVTAARVMQAALAGAPASGSVTGSFTFPLIMGLFSNTPTPAPAFGRDAVQAEFFDGPQTRTGAAGTVPEFYDEISGGRVSLAGRTFDWVRTSLSQLEVTAGESGLGSNSKTGSFIDEVLTALDAGGVDWGQFDNDGPDGVPNSGDDDGYVDVLTVMHPTPGAECSSAQRDNRIWSHRWNLYRLAQMEGFSQGSWTWSVYENAGWVTSTPATPSPHNTHPYIRLLDYTIQPVKSCNGVSINTIGVFAHELGHGFGLPDLYNTGSNYDHDGIGNWGLMGTGSWGCDGSSPERPCHMSAWSKEVLGWADVEVLPQGTDLGVLALPPVETSGTVFRVDAGDGSGEYVLLENRQRVGFDANLMKNGLLVWHIDPQWIAANRYSINADPDHMGVWLRQADGLDELARNNGGRGDPGDPFPGSTGNTEFHAGSQPGSWSHDGKTMGLTLTGIGQTGSDMVFDAVTGYRSVTLRTEGSPSGDGLITVDGVGSADPEWILASAPFQTHTVEAAPGVELEEGIRVGFQGWNDGGPRVREHTTGFQDAAYTATYGGREVRVAVELTGPVQGVSPGHVEFSPGDGEGWVPEGASVAMTAVPRTGFGFLAWSGALAGQPNPAVLTVQGPLQAGASFDLTFSTSSNVPSQEVEAAVPHVLELKVENANSPVVWNLVSGALPQGMSLDGTGYIRGVALERGDFPLDFRVVDGIGLQADLSLELVVTDPALPVSTVAGPFLLTGGEPTQDQKIYLDKEGNWNGAYDLGDLRAYVLRNPDLATVGQALETVELVVPMGDMEKPPSGGDGSGEGEGGRVNR